MAKFCGKCGHKLDDNTGLCPICNKEEIACEIVSDEVSEQSKKNKQKGIQQKEKLTRKQKREQKKSEKKADKARIKASRTFGQKVKRFFVKLLVIILVMAILFCAGLVGLVYYGVIEIPVINSFFDVIGVSQTEVDSSVTSDDVYINYETVEGIPEEYLVEPSDADDYYGEHSRVVDEYSAQDSNVVLSEKEAHQELLERGFDSFPITTQYTMAGEYYDDTEIDKSSSDKHPMYQTVYISKEGEMWSVMIINDTIFANPVSYNIQSQLNAQLMILEGDIVISYDSTKNKFYETYPDSDVLITKQVKYIDANTLDTLTIKEIDKL